MLKIDPTDWILRRGAGQSWSVSRSQKQPKEVEQIVLVEKRDITKLSDPELDAQFVALRNEIKRRDCEIV